MQLSFYSEELFCFGLKTLVLSYCGYQAARTEFKVSYRFSSIRILNKLRRQGMYAIFNTKLRPSDIGSNFGYLICEAAVYLIYKKRGTRQKLQKILSFSH